MKSYNICLNPFPKMRRYVVAAMALWLMIMVVSNGFAESKRVAVLYFEDHSHFDSPTGCGCIPTPIGKIFGGGKGRTKWNLTAGFPELLNRKLRQTQVYEPVSQDEIIEAMARLELSRKAVRSKSEKRGELAKALKVDALIAGDIRRFKQERARVRASRRLAGSASNQGQRSYIESRMQLGGSYYSATVRLQMKFYGASGDKIADRKIAATRRHQLGGAKIASLEAIVSETGTEFQLGPRRNPNKKKHPIVSTGALNRIEFPSPEYDQTLFGFATDEALKRVVMALRDTIGPEFVMPGEAIAQEEEGAESQSSRKSGPLGGEILYVDPNDPEQAYLNIGSGKGVAIRQQLTVYTKGEPLIDPNTGEVLGYVPKMVGRVEVVEVQTDRLSRVRIIEGFGVVKKGNQVKAEVLPTSETRTEK
jgi:hypothetical protein